MSTLIVTDHAQPWFEVPGALVVTARHYLAGHDAGREGAVRVLNLCRTGRYQGRGYYVSLLAEARGQRPLPDVKTVGEIRSGPTMRALWKELESLVSETLRHDESDRFQLDAYFGKDPAKRHPALAEKLFASLRAPLLRVLFRRGAEGWDLESVAAIGQEDQRSRRAQIASCRINIGRLNKAY